MVLGLIVGLVLSPFGLGVLSEASAEHVAPWIVMPGNLFLALIKMVVIPLVLSSIILGITSSEDINFLKKVSMRIFPYFIATTMLATSIGAGTALLIQPGQYIDSALIADVMENSSEADTPVVEPMGEQHLTDRLIDLIPTNYIRSALDQDMLATVILALFIGMAMVAVAPARMKPMFDFISAVQDISMKIIEWTMKLAPIAVFCADLQYHPARRGHCRHTEYTGSRHRHPGNHSSGHRGARVRHRSDHRCGPYSRHDPHHRECHRRSDGQRGDAIGCSKMSPNNRSTGKGSLCAPFRSSGHREK